MSTEAKESEIGQEMEEPLEEGSGENEKEVKTTERSRMNLLSDALCKTVDKCTSNPKYASTTTLIW